LQKYKNKIKKSNTMKLVELMKGGDIYDILKRDYMEERKTIEEMAQEYGVSTATIHNWFKIFDIPARKITFI